MGELRQIAIYGKGGIGKSTTTQNLTAEMLQDYACRFKQYQHGNTRFSLCHAFADAPVYHKFSPLELRIVIDVEIIHIRLIHRHVVPVIIWIIGIYNIAVGCTV